MSSLSWLPVPRENHRSNPVHTYVFAHMPPWSPQLLAYFSHVYNSPDLVSVKLQLAGLKNRLVLTQKKIRHWVLWLASNVDSERPKWVEVQNRHHVAKVCVICLAGVPQISKQVCVCVCVCV